MQPEALIQLLEVEQGKLAHSALTQSTQRDSFEYGRVSGLYLGVAHAIDIIKNAADEHKRADRG